MDSLSSNPLFNEELAVYQDGKGDIEATQGLDIPDDSTGSLRRSAKLKVALGLCLAVTVGLVGGMFLPSPLDAPKNLEAGTPPPSAPEDVSPGDDELVENPASSTGVSQWIQTGPAQDTAVFSLAGDCDPDSFEYKSKDIVNGIGLVGEAINIRSGSRRRIFMQDEFNKCGLCGDQQKYRCPDVVSQWTVDPKWISSESNQRTTSSAEYIERVSKTVSRNLGLSILSNTLMYTGSSQSSWMSEKSRQQTSEVKHLWELQRQVRYEINVRDLPVTQPVLEGLRTVVAEGTAAAAAKFIDDFGASIILAEPLGGYREVLYSVLSKEYNHAVENRFASEDCIELAIAGEYQGISGQLTGKVCASESEEETVRKMLSIFEMKRMPRAEPGNINQNTDVWQQATKVDPVPIGPQFTDTLRDVFRTAPITDVVDMMRISQLDDVDPERKLKGLLAQGMEAYETFLQGTCECLNGGKPVVQGPFSDSPDCECACTSNYYGEKCEFDNVDHLTFFRQNCDFNVMQLDDGTDVRQMTIKPDAGYLTSFSVHGKMNDDDLLYFNIECTCPSPCSAGEESAREGILSALGFYLAQADNGERTPITAHATTPNSAVTDAVGTCGNRRCCAEDAPPGFQYGDCFSVQGDMDSNDRLFFAVPFRTSWDSEDARQQAETAMEDLKGCRIQMGHSDWNRPMERYATVSFGSETCTSGPGGECRAVSICEGLFSTSCKSYTAGVLPLNGGVDSNDQFFARIDCTWAGLL